MESYCTPATDPPTNQPWPMQSLCLPPSHLFFAKPATLACCPVSVVMHYGQDTLGHSLFSPPARLPRHLCPWHSAHATLPRAGWLNGVFFISTFSEKRSGCRRVQGIAESCLGRESPFEIAVRTYSGSAIQKVFTLKIDNLPLSKSFILRLWEVSMEESCNNINEETGVISSMSVSICAPWIKLRLEFAPKFWTAPNLTSI